MSDGFFKEITEIDISLFGHVPDTQRNQDSFLDLGTHCFVDMGSDEHIRPDH